MHGWSFVFTTVWLLLPIVATLLVSCWKPVFFSRFLIICLVPALVLFGEGLILVSPQNLSHAALAVVVIGSLIAVRSFYRQPPSIDWRPAIAFLAQNASPNDVLVFQNPYCRFPFDYTLHVSGLQFPQVRMEMGDVAAVREFPAPARHLWVLDFGANNHPFWSNLPTGNDQSDRVRLFFFRRTWRFPGVDVQEFERNP
jgi:hypothetical protein